MYLLQVLQTHKVQRIVHLILLLVSFEVFLPHRHLQLDEHDVSCCFCSLVMDTLWKGVLSYDRCSIDTLIATFLFWNLFFEGLRLPFLKFDCFIPLVWMARAWSSSLSRASLLVTLASSSMQSYHTMSNFIFSFLAHRVYMNESQGIVRPLREVITSSSSSRVSPIELSCSIN